MEDDTNLIDEQKNMDKIERKKRSKAASRAKYYRAHADKLREYNHEWYLRNREHILESRKTGRPVGRPRVV